VPVERWVWIEVGSEVVDLSTPKHALDLVVKNLHQTSWGKARGWIESGKIFVNGVVQTECRHLVDLSSQIELRMNAPRKPTSKLLAKASGLQREQVIYLDQDIVTGFRQPAKPRRGELVN
jgi:23S rRNA-/tRNA-specific pseudouridylate synthase